MSKAAALTSKSFVPAGVVALLFPRPVLGVLSGAKNRAVSDPTQSEKKKSNR